MQWLLALILLLSQDNPGQICVAAYEDLNANGMFEDEPSLPGISVNLLNAEDIIIATAVTSDGDDLLCFEDLPPATYNIRFDESPNHDATTVRDGTVELNPGQRLELRFGGVTVSPFMAADAAPEQITGDELDLTTRLLIATFATVLAVLFMVGFGALVASLIS